MKKLATIAALAAAATLASTPAMAKMEKCRIIVDNAGAIKEGKGQCATSKHSCAGQNKAGDPEAWILLTKKQCHEANQGNFKNLTKGDKDRINLSMFIKKSDIKANGVNKKDEKKRDPSIFGKK